MKLHHLSMYMLMWGWIFLQEFQIFPAPWNGLFSWWATSTFSFSKHFIGPLISWGRTANPRAMNFFLLCLSSQTREDITMELLLHMKQSTWSCILSKPCLRVERESWRFPLWNYDYQRDCRSQVCSIYQTLSAPFFPGCLWMLLVKQPATTPSVPPQTVPSVPHLSLPLVSESLPSLHVISVQQSSDSSGLFQTSFAVSTRHTVPCDARRSCDPLCFGSHKSGTHGYFLASMDMIWWIRCVLILWIRWIYASSVFLSPLMHLHYFIPL